MSSGYRIKSHVAAVAAVIREAGARSVVEVAEDALTEANDRVPRDEGDLGRSGGVTAFPETAQAAITYESLYAVRQHEDSTLNHPRGGEDHWLERTVEENADRYVEHIASAIKRATRR